MDAAAIVIQNAIDRQKPAQELILHHTSPVQQFYDGSTIFITGGSGFLGKQLLEKLLRSCKIKKVIMLLRPKKDKTVEERLKYILKDALYDTLREEQPNFDEKITPIVGDVAEADLGISEEERQQIIEEVDIIFHVAATIAFQAPLRSATITNIRGTRDLVKLAKQCKKIRRFVHFSTAYSHATYSRRGGEVLEQFYPCPMSPDLMIELAETLDEKRLNDITDGLIKDWPNTYSFTKALAEELLRSKAGDLPVSIIRPSVVICARREPYAGWIDRSSIMGPNGMILGCMTGIIHALHTDLKIKIDFIPVDYVTNAAIAAATTSDPEPKIYTVGSSSRNDITWGKASEDGLEFCTIFFKTREVVLETLRVPDK
ncbi:fatty acyl-CoA reductase wat-like [Trichoplusia ni]|uniref:Fatty acyl-CoA reductase n=1 Tax=Trichoplusia ni TaxID=7111 RepID=A0A7E5WH72_TRINI|nr:fatty acyl-CoA reductase wat-like [Trichoplusia ni]